MAVLEPKVNSPTTDHVKLIIPSSPSSPSNSACIARTHSPSFRAKSNFSPPISAKSPSVAAATARAAAATETSAATALAIFTLAIIIPILAWASRVHTLISYGHLHELISEGRIVAVARMAAAQDTVIMFQVQILVFILVAIFRRNKRIMQVGSSLIFILFVLPIATDWMSMQTTGVRVDLGVLTMLLSHPAEFASSVPVWEVLGLRALCSYAILLLTGIWFVRKVNDLSPLISQWERQGTHNSKLRLAVVLVAGYCLLVPLSVATVVFSRQIGSSSRLDVLYSSNIVFLLETEFIGLSPRDAPKHTFIADPIFDQQIEPNKHKQMPVVVGTSPTTVSAAAAITSSPPIIQKMDGMLATDSSFSSLLLDAVSPSEIYSRKNIHNEKIRHQFRKFPYMRRTLNFQGEKNFDVKKEEQYSGKPKRPNVIFLMMESWRHRDVGVLGAKDRLKQFNVSATPNFDKLSGDGVLFDNFHSNGMQTSRSILSSLYGIMPKFARSAAIKLGNQLHLFGLPHILTSLGYTTSFASATTLSWEHWDAFLSSHGFEELMSKAQFESKLEQMHGKTSTAKSSSSSSWGLDDGDSFVVLAEMLKEQQKQQKPYFINFYSISSHHPWKVPDAYSAPKWIEKLVNSTTSRDPKTLRQYLTALAYSDHLLGEFFETLKHEGTMDNTVFFVQGDHGYGMCDHPGKCSGWGNETPKVWDEVMRVPLLVLGGEGMISEQDRGKVIHDAGSQVDLLNTVVDIIGAPENGFLQHGIGRSLMRRYPSGTALLTNPFHGEAQGVKVGDIKYMFDGSGRYFVYDVDGVDKYELNPTFSGKLTDTAPNAPTVDVLNAHRLVSSVVESANMCYDTNTFFPE